MLDVTMLAAPVLHAQGWNGGAMDPAAVSNPMAVQAAARAQARRLAAAAV